MASLFYRPGSQPDLETKKQSHYQPENSLPGLLRGGCQPQAKDRPRNIERNLPTGSIHYLPDFNLLLARLPARKTERGQGQSQRNDPQRIREDGIPVDHDSVNSNQSVIHGGTHLIVQPSDQSYQHPKQDPRFGAQGDGVGEAVEQVGG